MIDISLARRASWGLALWRDRAAEIRSMPAGGLSVPSCSEPGRSYWVPLAGEGRCGCDDWRRRKEPAICDYRLIADQGCNDVPLPLDNYRTPGR